MHDDMELGTPLLKFGSDPAAHFLRVRRIGP